MPAEPSSYTAAKQHSTHQWKEHNKFETTWTNAYICGYILFHVVNINLLQFVKEYPTEYIDSIFTDLTTMCTYKPGSIRFRNISKSTRQNLTKFSGFWGVPIRLRIPQNLEIWQRGFKGGGGKEKSLTPIFSPLGGPGPPQIFLTWGSPLSTSTCKNVPTYPLRGLPQIFETVSKNFGGWIPKHGVLRGLPSSECRIKFFEGLGRKNAQTFFIFFEFRPRGWAMPPQKWSNIWHF